MEDGEEELLGFEGEEEVPLPSRMWFDQSLHGTDSR